MLNLNQIKGYFPEYIRENQFLAKYMYKEYVQVLILDYLSSSKWIKRLEFIGGTNLRLVKGIDRFSEDLDFDCKEFTTEEFKELSEDVLKHLKRFGFNVEIKEKESMKLNAYSSSYYFPGLLYKLGLSQHQDERFLIKLECQDQKFKYKPKTSKIRAFGYYISIREPYDDILCAMKINALITRKKGRDFYDVMFLLIRTKPDFKFLSYKQGINNAKELRSNLIRIFENVNINNKVRDFEHLVFDKNNCKKILKFKDFISELK